MLNLFVKTARLLKEMANSELFAASSLNINKFRVNNFENYCQGCGLREISTQGVNINAEFSAHASNCNF